jgi:penicillin-binding protein 1A
LQLLFWRQRKNFFASQGILSKEKSMLRKPKKFEETGFFYQEGERISISLHKLYFPIVFLLNISTMLLIGLTIISYPLLFQNLPTLEEARQVTPLAPAEFYSKDGVLLATYGDKLRQPVAFHDIPEIVRQAFVAAEDSRFFTHPGVDYQGLTRALLNVLQTQEKSQGGSTITMQLARELFLSREKTLNRKFKEILIALRMEQSLSKEEIFTLYLNKIFLGHSAYGIAAAAQVYYQKPLEALTVAQAASLAGLPKAPSAYNPIINPQRALLRRSYVLGRMYRLGFIDEHTYHEAIASPETAKLFRPDSTRSALGLYAVEMARQELFASLGEKLYEDGYQVFLTIDSQLQAQAEAHVHDQLEKFDRKRGYRGPEAHLAVPNEYKNFLAKAHVYGSLEPAVVTGISSEKAELLLKNDRSGLLPAANAAWIGKRSLPLSFKVGDVIRVRKTKEKGVFSLQQVPEVSAAVVVQDTYSGEIMALVGGYDFFYSKFNRATQGKRSPGSSFKPFIYSAALEHGFAPNSIVIDAPLTIGNWRPKNYGGGFKGSMTVRSALAQSRNLPVIRVMRKIGEKETIEFIKKFGFRSEQLPVNLTLALGTAVVTPLDMSNAFAVFANGGYLLTPRVIAEIRQYGVVQPQVRQYACQDCPTPAPRVISAGNAFLMQSLLQEVIRKGTGRRALALNRNDIAGKTGTTNEERDAWFVGFHPDVVAAVWVGYDDYKPLGAGESGGSTALPIWIDIMAEILPTLPQKPFTPPEGIAKVGGDYYFAEKPVVNHRAETEAPASRTPSTVNEVDDSGLAGGLF